MAKWKIVNVVATASLNQKVNLIELGKHDEVSYDPNVYGGRVAYFRSPNIKGTVSIFSSGRMISVGAKSEEEAISALEYVKDFLVKKKLINPIILKTKTRNIVVMVNFEMRVDLEELTEKCRMIYEPEQFPGGILKVDKPYKATALLFSSGKAVITGLKASNKIDPTIQEIISMMKEVA